MPGEKKFHIHEDREAVHPRRVIATSLDTNVEKRNLHNSGVILHKEADTARRVPNHSVRKMRTAKIAVGLSANFVLALNRRVTWLFNCRAPERKLPAGIRLCRRQLGHSHI